MYSTQTTPSRRGLSDAGATVYGMTPELKRDVDERFVNDKLGVKEFVHCVWGVDQHVIDTIFDVAETFKSEILNGLIDRYRGAAKEKESRTYGPFSEIGNYLREKLEVIFPEHKFVNRLCSGDGEMVINSGYNKRKPDTIVVPNDYEGKFDWEHVLVPFEFKTRVPSRSGYNQQKSRLSASITAGSSSLSKTLFPPPDNGKASSSLDDSKTHSGTATPDVPANSSRAPPTDKDDSSVTAHASDQSAALNSRRNPIVAMSTSVRQKKVDINRKTKGQSLNSLDSGLSGIVSANKRIADNFAVPQSPKRRKSNLHATVEQLQLARYALECMAAASRHYVAGVFIHRFNISLWYYDRAIVARTVNFDFETQPEMLALVLYGLLTCDSRRAGFDPFIIPASHPSPSNIDELFNAPTSIEQSKDDQIVIIQKDGSVKRYKITGKRVFANRCLVGRGTVVLPVQAIDEDGVSDEEEVMKISWPDKVREREAYLIRKLREVIPEMAKHLPDVSSFCDMGAEDLDLPRHSLDISVIEGYERQLHMMAMKRYKALWDVNSVEEFQEVFVDYVECTFISSGKLCV